MRKRCESGAEAPGAAPPGVAFTSRHRGPRVAAGSLAAGARALAAPASAPGPSCFLLTLTICTTSSSNIMYFLLLLLSYFLLVSI